MQDLKIDFVDFWGGFDKKDNYFYHLLNSQYDIEISEDPDILFFSVDYSGKSEYIKYKDHRCKKVFFTGESVSPNFDSENPLLVSNFSSNYSINRCDFSFSFDRLDDHRNYRLPLWVTYIDWFDKGSYGQNPSFLTPSSYIEEGSKMGNNSDKFCAFIFSNPTKERLWISNQVSKYKKVNCYGSPFGNGSSGEFSKYQILKDYKFSICIENRIRDGYFTEKLFHAKTSGTIPIYNWNKDDLMDFNPSCFINISDFEDVPDLVDYLKMLDNDTEQFNKIRSEKLFSDQSQIDKFSPDSVLKHFRENILA